MTTGEGYGNQKQITFYVSKEMYSIFDEYRMSEGGISKAGKSIMLMVSELLQPATRIFLETEMRQRGCLSIFDAVIDIIRDNIKEQNKLGGGRL